MPLHYSNSDSKRWLCLIAALLLAVAPLAVFGQRPAAPGRRRPATPDRQRPTAPSDPRPSIAGEDGNPIFVTTHLYQARAKEGSYPEVNGQVYRLKTDSLTDEEKWIGAFRKIYPGFEFAQLQSARLKVYRSSRPTPFLVGSSGTRRLEVLQTAAYSYGDGKTPGTTLVIELNINFGRPEALALDIETLEVEDGMTYFFTVPRLRLKADDYVNFIRHGAPRAPFEGDDIRLIFAFSVELKETEPKLRVLDEQQSLEFVAEATRRVDAEVPEAIRNLRLSGSVRTRVEITPEGRVAHAHIVSSSFPEMNELVLAAARQWEFSTRPFASDKRPISAILRFDYAPPPAPKR